MHISDLTRNKVNVLVRLAEDIKTSSCQALSVCVIPGALVCHSTICKDLKLEQMTVQPLRSLRKKTQSSFASIQNMTRRSPVSALVGDTSRHFDKYCPWTKEPAQMRLAGVTESSVFSLKRFPRGLHCTGTL